MNLMWPHSRNSMKQVSREILQIPFFTFKNFIIFFFFSFGKLAAAAAPAAPAASSPAAPTAAASAPQPQAARPLTAVEQRGPRVYASPMAKRLAEAQQLRLEGKSNYQFIYHLFLSLI